MAKIKYPEFEKANRIREVRAGIERTEKYRQQYEQDKIAYMKSEEGQFQQSLSAIVQPASKAEEEAYKMIFNAIKTLRIESVELISKCVADEKEKLGYVRPKTMQEVLTKMEVALLKIKKVCEMPQYQKRLTQGCYTEYEKLFNDLIDKVDVGFAIFAPIKPVARKTVKFKALKEEVKDIVYAHCVALGLDKNEEFMAKHEAEFANQIQNGYGI